MKLTEFTKLLTDAVNEGAEDALNETQVYKDFITKSEAYLTYGRSNVDRWMKEGLVQSEHASNKAFTIQIDRKKLARVAYSSNRITYLATVDR
nr:hypothetical protein [Pedobacter panaciterrae]